MAMSAVFCLRSLRRSNTISKAIQNSSRPPEMRKAGMPTPSRQQNLAAEAEEGQDAEGDQARPHGHPASLPRVHAPGQRDEDRRKRHWVEGDEQGHQGGGDVVEEHRLDLIAGFALWPSSAHLAR